MKASKCLEMIKRRQLIIVLEDVKMSYLIFDIFKEDYEEKVVILDCLMGQ